MAYHEVETDECLYSYTPDMKTLNPSLSLKTASALATPPVSAPSSP